MLCKVIKKLGLGPIAASLLVPAVKPLSGPPLAMTAEDAEALLAGCSPDPRGSAYCPDRESFTPEYDLAIIIPVYNVEKYLPVCIESVLSQKTRFSFRAIFIDDGATDGSAAILDALPADPRVQVIHQKNKGLSGARNTGIAAARGKYLLFLDSDDCLAPGAVEALLSAATEKAAALVQGSFATFRDGAAPRPDWSAAADFVENPPLENLPGYAWGKLIRADLFQNLQFPEGYWFEDSINAQILFPLLRQKGETVLALGHTVCHYRENPQGISARSVGKPRSLDAFWLARQLHTDRRKFGLNLTQSDYEYLLDAIRLTYERTAGLPENIQKALFIQWNAFLEEQFPGFRTQRKAFSLLENAVKTKHFKQYRLCCKLL